MEKKYCKQLINQIKVDKDLEDNWVLQNFPHKKHIKVNINIFENYKWFINLIKKDVKRTNPNLELSEWITLLVYKKGDYFKPHTDASSYDAYLSAGYILNKDYEGGDYIIKGNTLNNIEIGELFTFGRDDMHEITEVTNGIRYSIHYALKNPKKSII